jgi:hypothetical protein
MTRRIKLPFWRRQAPLKKYDIKLLRPSILPKKGRFESIVDAKAERARSDAVLRSAAGGQVYAEILSDCRAKYYRCDQPFCPICARRFRRWFIGQLLRITKADAPMQIITVLLQAAPRDRIDELDLDCHRATLRKRIQRSGLGDAVIMGGFEVAYKANLRKWVLHANLLVIGGPQSARRKFTESFSGTALERPVVCSPLLDRPKQLSYLLKFTTYHRPYKQNGSSRSQAVPLNTAQHLTLVRWMAKQEFPHFLFLFNARRLGAAIKI